MTSRRDFIKDAIFSSIALAVPLAASNELPAWKKDLVSGIQKIFQTYMYEDTRKISQLHKDICKFLERCKARNKLHAIHVSYPKFNSTDGSLRVQIAVQKTSTVEYSIFDFKAA